jgi:hypothetical protein
MACGHQRRGASPTPILEIRVVRKVPPCTGQKGINSNPLFTVYKTIGPCRSDNIFAMYKTTAAKNSDGNGSSF